MGEVVRLERTPVKTLTVVLEVDGKEVEAQIPLMQYLPVKQVMSINEARANPGQATEVFIDLLVHYLGDEVMEAITFEDAGRIISLWKEASEVSVGESSGRPES